MNDVSMVYFQKEDILHLTISNEPEAGSIEISPTITVELNERGDMIGIEIINASHFIRDSVMDSVQAGVLRAAELQSV